MSFNFIEKFFFSRQSNKMLESQRLRELMNERVLIKCENLQINEMIISYIHKIENSRFKDDLENYNPKKIVQTESQTDLNKENRIAIIKNNLKEVLNVQKSGCSESIQNNPKKRKLNESVEHSSIKLEVDNNNGKMVRLFNISHEKVSIGSWKVQQTNLNNNFVVEYRFGSRTFLRPKLDIKIWSSNSGITHYPASRDFVLNCLNWFTDDSIETSLIDKNGKVNINCCFKNKTKPLKIIYFLLF